MKKLLLFLVGSIFSMHCAAQVRITEFQRILGTSDPSAALEVELNLNTARTVLNTTMLERAFSNGCNRSHFSLFKKNQDLFSHSIEFMNIGYSDFRFFPGNNEFYDRRDFGKPGIAGYQLNLRLINLPTRFEDIIREDGVLTKDFLNIEFAPQSSINRAFGGLDLFCRFGPGFYIDGDDMGNFPLGNLIFRLGSDLARWFLYGWEGSYVNPRNRLAPYRGFLLPPRRKD